MGTWKYLGCRGALTFMAAAACVQPARPLASRLSRRFFQEQLPPDRTFFPSVKGHPPVTPHFPLGRVLFNRRLTTGARTYIPLPWGRSPNFSPHRKSTKLISILIS